MGCLMRTELQELEGIRGIFIGEFVKVSGKKAHSGKGLAVLIRNIRQEGGTKLADHLWLNYSEEFEMLQLQESETIIFRARVREYLKGKHGETTDYKLQYPSKIQRYGMHVFTGNRRKRGNKK